MKVFINNKPAYSDALELKSFFSKLKGLMFSSRVEKPLVFFFTNSARTENAIHSFFCPRFDAVFISKDFIVVDVFENIAPWNPFISSSRDAKYLVETFPFDAAKKGFRKGVRVRFE
ncbi:DUF192 domain-containing protein [Candidatus Micrarchaeota archaeon]|nr:DUF192 domain-containing protein [Candidatus Micrarchaeota archaeon]